MSGSLISQKKSGTAKVGADTSLQCPMCNVPYDTITHQPKLLPCHHCFCLVCLEQLAVGRAIFRCPNETCKKKTNVPEYGVDHLPDNFYIEQIQTVIAPPTSAQTPSESSVTSCHKHMNQPLLFYCSTCMVPICMNCTVLDHDKTKGHQIQDIGEVINSNNELLKQKLQNVNHGLKMYQSNLNMLKTEMTNLEITKVNSIAAIEETYQQYQNKLRERFDTLKQNVKKLYQDAKHHIVSQVEGIKSRATELNKCKNNIENGLETQSVANALQLSHSIKNLAIVDPLCDAAKTPLCYRANYIEFIANHEHDQFVSSLQNLGKVVQEKMLPSKIEANQRRHIAGVQAAISFHVLDGNGEALTNYPITLFQQFQKHSEKKEVKLKPHKNGIYSYEFKPKFSGTYEFMLYFQNSPIWGSNKEVTVYPNNPVQIFGGTLNADTEKVLNRPTSVAVSSKGDVYVADMGNKRIHIYDSSGKSSGTFNVGGSESTTYDIAINHATDELICTKIGPNEHGQSIGNTFRIFGLNGEKKKQFSNKEMKKAMFLDVNSRGHIVCTDCADNAVHIYSKDGIPLKKFGSFGSKQGQLDFPTAIAIGKDDTIIIADTKNNRIQLFNSHGKFLSLIGPELGNSLEMKGPRGVTADSNYIFVADSYNRILIMKYNGHLVACIESEGDPIQEPYNLALSGDNHVLVADYRNNCVKKYKYN